MGHQELCAGPPEAEAGGLAQELAHVDIDYEPAPATPAAQIKLITGKAVAASTSAAARNWERDFQNCATGSTRAPRDDRPITSRRRRRRRSWRSMVLLSRRVRIGCGSPPVYRQ